MTTKESLNPEETPLAMNKSLGWRDMTLQETEWFENLPVSWETGDILRLEADSTTLTVKKNGVTVGTRPLSSSTDQVFFSRKGGCEFCTSG